ncbi:MAG: copper resistance protein CopC [Deinococcota bacterium]|nr:copper resistance protein CopC [Deinococcota bacterium]
MAALTSVGAAHAHAYLSASTPEQNVVIADLPEEIRLVYSEPVEVRFSLFKVYALEADPELSLEADAQRLSGLAGALVSEVLEARGDDDARADAGVSTEARTGAEITLALKEGLEPGHYVVMWRVLSIDTHTTQGFYLFTYDPFTHDPEASDDATGEAGD